MGAPQFGSAANRLKHRERMQRAVDQGPKGPAQTTSLKTTLSTIRICFARGQRTEATKMIARASNEHPHSRVFHAAAARILDEANAHLAAETLCKSFIKRNPDSPDGWSDLAIHYVNIGELNEANKCLTIAQNIDPLDISVLERRLAVLVKLNSPGEANTMVENARSALAEEETGNDILNFRVVLLRAKLAYHQGDFKLASSMVVPILNVVDPTNENTRTILRRALSLFIATHEIHPCLESALRETVGDAIYDRCAQRATKQITYFKAATPPETKLKFGGGNLFDDVYRPEGINGAAFLQSAEIPGSRAAAARSRAGVRNLVATGAPNLIR